MANLKDSMERRRARLALLMATDIQQVELVRRLLVADESCAITPARLFQMSKGTGKNYRPLQDDLARLIERVAGKPPHWLDDDQENPESEMSLRHVSQDDIFNNASQPSDGLNVFGPNSWRPIIVRGSISVGHDGRVSAIEDSPRNGEVAIEYSLDPQAHAYAIKITGEVPAAFPLKHGSLLIVAPSLELVDDWFVLVTMKDGSQVLRQLVSHRGTHEFRLASLVDQSQRTVLTEDDIQSIALAWQSPRSRMRVIAHEPA